MVIQSIQKALRILNIVSDNENSPITISELSKITQINVSTCAHIVSTLNAEGFLKKVSHTKGYVLGPSVYCLNNHDKYNSELVQICRPVLKWLHKKTNNVVVLATIESGQKFIIDHIDNEHLVFEKHFEIQRDSLYRTATGRIIMAHMNTQELKEIYKLHGKPTDNHWDKVTSFETLCMEINKIDKKQVLKTIYKSPDSNLLSIGIAAAIYNRYSCCIGAIGVAYNCSLEEYHNIIKQEPSMEVALLKARNEISRRLKF